MLAISSSYPQGARMAQSRRDMYIRCRASLHTRLRVVGYVILQIKPNDGKCLRPAPGAQGYPAVSPA